MPLIPEARAIKDMLRDADAHAAAVAEKLLGLAFERGKKRVHHA